MSLPGEINIYSDRTSSPLSALQHLVSWDKLYGQPEDWPPRPMNLIEKIFLLNRFHFQMPLECPQSLTTAQPEITRLRQTLIRLFEALQSLKSLTLDLVPSSRIDCELDATIQLSSQILTNVKLPQLQELDMKGIIARENLLTGFIMGDAETLKALGLADITMDWRDRSWYSNAPQESNGGSIYNLFKAIHDHCKLGDATLSGRFHDGNGEEWLAYTRFRRPCIRAEIKDYLCHRLDGLESEPVDNNEPSSGGLPPSISMLKCISTIEKKDRPRFAELDDFSRQTCSTMVGDL